MRIDNNGLTSLGRNGEGTLIATQLKNWLAKQKTRDKFLLNLSLVILKIITEILQQPHHNTANQHEYNGQLSKFVASSWNMDRQPAVMVHFIYTTSYGNSYFQHFSICVVCYKIPQTQLPAE